MAALVACCTCASVLVGSGTIGQHQDVQQQHLETKNEKQFSTPQDRKLDCCGRVICGPCIYTNPRFAAYCPYCQLASSPTNPLPHGLRDPPSYDFATTTTSKTTASPEHHHHQQPLRPPPPPYYQTTTTTTTTTNKEDEEKNPPPLETIHHIHPTNDTIPSLALRYNLPAALLRAHNNLPADHLLPARRTLRIPGRAVSLAPTPPADDARKRAVRRWMVRCKCADYDVAVLYLDACGGGDDEALVDEAVRRFLEDEEWERRNPLAKGKGKGMTPGGGGGVWASQAAFLRRGGGAGGQGRSS